MIPYVNLFLFTNVFGCFCGFINCLFHWALFLRFLFIFGLVISFYFFFSTF